MAPLKIVEECLVSCPPAPASVSLPLIFFDIPWLLFPPTQPLFFFQLAHDNSIHNHNCLEYFSSTILPRLKHSLSSALQHFFPFTAKLATSLGQLVFLTDKDSSVHLTVALCDADFIHLSSYQPRNAHSFHQLVPSLPHISSTAPTTTTTTISLAAIQITYFPSSAGFSIGLAYHPALCDQRTFCNFLQSWASLCKFGHLQVQPTFDRSVILDSDGLHPILWKRWSHLASNAKMVIPPIMSMVRATFFMGTTHIGDAKRWIQARCHERNRSCPVLLSPYVVTCAFVWACLLRAQLQSSVSNAQGLVYFGFIAGGIARLAYQVPASYFGNCVGFGRAAALREELLGDDGILAAADAIGLTIKALDSDLLGGADSWISDWQPLIGSGEHMNVVGSPKVNLYETDFGWGRPKKIEEISIDVMRGISLTESRDMKGGMEIGLTLPDSQLEAFSTLFNQGLHVFAVGDSF